MDKEIGIAVRLLDYLMFAMDEAAQCMNPLSVCWLHALDVKYYFMCPMIYSIISPDVFPMCEKVPNAFKGMKMLVLAQKIGTLQFRIVSNSTTIELTLSKAVSPLMSEGPVAHFFGVGWLKFGMNCLVYPTKQSNQPMHQWFIHQQLHIWSVNLAVVVVRSAQTLSMRFYGPFTVLECIGSFAYRLQLPPSSRLHPVFHAALLKPNNVSEQVTVHPLPELETGSHPLHIPRVIMAERTIWRNGEAIPQVLVQWSASLHEDSSWADASKIQIPSLEDKAHLEGGGNVTEQGGDMGPEVRDNKAEPKVQTVRPRRMKTKPIYLNDFVTS